MDPGAVLLALLGDAEPRQPRLGHHAVRRDRRHRHRRGRRAGRRRPARQGQHGKGARRRHRRPGRRVASSTRGWGPPWPSPSAPATSPSPAPGRWASRTASTSATRAARRRSGSFSRGGPRPGRRLPGAGPPGHRRQRELLQRVALGRRSLPTRPDRRSSACSRTSSGASGPPSGGAGDVVVLSARPCPDWPARSTRRSPGRRPTTARRRSTSPREAALQRCLRGGRRARALLRRPRTSAAAAWRSPSPSARIWGGSAPRLQLGVGSAPAVELFGESPGRVVVTVGPAAWSALAALGRGARRAPPAHRRGRAASGSSSRSSGRGPRAPRRSAARASPTPSTVADRAAGRLGARPAACPRRPGSRRRSARRPEPMCGVVGIHAPGQEAAGLAALALFALQHRGQESAGVAVSDGEGVMVYKDLGMVAQVLDERRLPSLRGHLAIAHCRYSTTGSTALGEQPADLPPRSPADGRRRPQRQPRQHPAAARRCCPAGGSACGARPTRSCSRRSSRTCPADDLVDALLTVLPQVSGAYSLVVMDEHRVIGVRDPHGFRPLAGPPAWEDAAIRRARGAGGALPWPGTALAARWLVLRRRRPPSTSSAPSSCATSSPARWSCWASPAARARSASREARSTCASSSSSTSPGRTPTCWAATSTRRAGGWARRWRARRRSTPTLVMPVPDTGAPAAAGYAEAIGHPVPRGDGQEPLRRPDLHPALASRCASAA